MVFSSIFFLLIFLPLFLLIYQIIDKKWKNLFLLLSSIFFYSWGAPKFVFVIIISTIIDFYLVRKLYNTEKVLYRKLLLSTSLILNIGLLAYFKYANFFIDNLNQFISSLGFEQFAWTSVALPIGISFYTFQTLTYSIDIYRKLHTPLDKVTDYLLYIMSFPQMIAGPIVRFTYIAEQITSRVETIDDKLIGFYRFCIGLAKKVLIANVMAQQADLIFDSNINELSTANAWIGMIAYTFQIYFDFSGYSDMAIGLGRMMGFTFPENFMSPYTSKNISEFWRKWHITLGSFMRDYLYIPLGGSKVSSKNRLYFNLWIVFLLSGLWHGAAWNFVIWGAFHGVFLILDRLFLIKILEKLGTIPSIAFTFLIVMISWVIFRLEEVDKILLFTQKLFVFNNSENISLIPGFIFTTIIAIIFSFIVISKIGKRAEIFFFNKDSYSSIQNIYLTILSIVFLIISISSISTSGFNPFIYFRF